MTFDKIPSECTIHFHYSSSIRMQHEKNKDPTQRIHFCKSILDRSMIELCIPKLKRISAKILRQQNKKKIIEFFAAIHLYYRGAKCM